MCFTHVGPLFLYGVSSPRAASEKGAAYGCRYYYRHLCDVFCNHCFCRSVAEPKVISVAL